MELDNAVNNLDNVEQIDSELSALASIDSDIEVEDQIETELGELNVISVTYTGEETDNIIVRVNSTDRTISATLKQVQYLSAEEFPEVGSDKLLYIDLSNTSIWFFDSETNTYKQAVNTEGLATEDFVNNLLKDYATKDFVEENGGKIDTISINGEIQEIVNKNVNIDLSSYSTNENVNSVKQELQENIDKSNELIDSVAKDLSDIAQDVGEDIDNINKQFNDYAKLKANQTFTGSQTIVGNLTIEGNITQNGENYITQAEKVETEDDYILMRKGATGGLGSGYSGFEVENYNGAGDNARLVVDTNGIARVGDVGDEQPLLTREETTDLVDGEVLVWNSTTNRAEGSSAFEKTEDVDKKLSNKRDITTNSNKLYATNASGNQTEASYGTGLSAYMIVQRGAGGQIATTDPTADVHVVNLQTMNAALSNKRDIVTNANKLYATDESGNQTEVVYGRTTDAYGIVQRGAGGQIAVADAKNNDHATNLGQVNSLIESKYQELYDLLPTVEILD